MNEPICCNHNCREGRDCPNRTPLDVAAAVRYLRAYLDIFLRYCDHAAAKRAGHLAAVTKPEPEPEKPKWRDRFDPQAVVIVLACIFTWLGVFLASVWGR